MMIRFLAILVACLAFAIPAQAASWIIDPQKGHLDFSGVQGSTAFEGSFRKFDVTITFDIDHPENGSITATIDIASITAGNSERDSFLPQTDWFDTKNFPQAQFVSKRIGKLAEHHYEAEGNLTIKNITKPVKLAFTLMPEEDHWRVKGETKLLRPDFHIGEGKWSGEDYVKHAVTVTFDLWAKPKG